LEEKLGPKDVEMTGDEDIDLKDSDPLEIVLTDAGFFLGKIINKEMLALMT
jgi:hypothetical protein